MGTVFTALDVPLLTEGVEDVWISKKEVEDMKNKVIKALRIVSGTAIVVGFIATMGVIGADDVATISGVCTDIGELIKKLMLCQVLILGGTAGLNIL